LKSHILLVQTLRYVLCQFARVAKVLSKQKPCVVGSISIDLCRGVLSTYVSLWITAAAFLLVTIRIVDFGEDHLGQSAYDRVSPLNTLRMSPIRMFPFVTIARIRTNQSNDAVKTEGIETFRGAPYIFCYKPHPVVRKMKLQRMTIVTTSIIMTEEDQQNDAEQISILLLMITITKTMKKWRKPTTVHL